MQKGLFGSQQFVVKVSDERVNDPHNMILYGEEEAKMTAEVAAFTAVKLQEEPFPANAYQLPDIVTVDDLLTLPRLSRV